MDKKKLERFAQYARKYLIKYVSEKMEAVLHQDSSARRYYPKQVRALEDEIKKTGKKELVAERGAYTWFNRLTALRYMDINHYTRVGVISPLPGQFQPEILAEAKAGHIDDQMVNEEQRKRVFNLLSGQETHNDPQNEAYRILIVSVCNYYHRIMPFLFERIADWSELLMPEDLLSGSSILSYIREALTPDSCKDVEVIGWLYQYYISEKKDEVMTGLKKNRKIANHEIPAATQLFTPHWIVKYMTQNSLGRLWLLNRPDSKIKEKMEYYIPPEADNNDHQTNYLKISSPEEILVCDPCCGSGHILTYSFDLLYDIYEEQGYDPSDIPGLIIEKNLYGIEIDERAGELAAFALTMKARAKDRLWFSHNIKPHVCVLKNISFSEDEIEDYMDRCGRDLFSQGFEKTLKQFGYTDTVGSLIIPEEQDLKFLSQSLSEKRFEEDAFLAPVHRKVRDLIEQADYLSSKYHVVITNPPYMGGKGMNNYLKDFLAKNYPNVKSDLFSAFVVRNLELALPMGQLGFMTPFVWMFISSYEKLRDFLIKEKTITSLIQLEYSGFEGATVPICTFTLENNYNPNFKGGYVRLSDFRGAAIQGEKAREIIQAARRIGK